MKDYWKRKGAFKYKTLHTYLASAHHILVYMNVCATRKITSSQMNQTLVFSCTTSDSANKTCLYCTTFPLYPTIWLSESEKGLTIHSIKGIDMFTYTWICMPITHTLTQCNTYSLLFYRWINKDIWRMLQKIVNIVIKISTILHKRCENG